MGAMRIPSYCLADGFWGTLWLVIGGKFEKEIIEIFFFGFFFRPFALRV